MNVPIFSQVSDFTLPWSLEIVRLMNENQRLSERVKRLSEENQALKEGRLNMKCANPAGCPFQLKCVECHYA